MFRTSHIELSLSALKRNIKFMKKHLRPDVVFSSVVKGNAYGHGIRNFVPMAEKAGIRHFSVYSAGEAYLAHQVHTANSHIMIMGALDNAEVGWAIENDISFYVFGTRRLETAIQDARRIGKKARIHLELETGLNRMGLKAEALEHAVELIKANHEHLEIEGFSTHYAGAESVANYVRVRNQIETYREMVVWLNKQGLEAKLHHTASSAAVLNYPETVYDMARVGIAQYGYWPTQETEMLYWRERQGGTMKLPPNPLRRVIKWVSRVMNIKRLGRGEFVGYGNSFLTTRPSVIAAVPVGYWHGFSRALSNYGRVLIHGKRAPVVGAVNMNMMMVDVTDCNGVEEGDEVVILGKQKKAEITVGSFADLSGMLNYETLVRLPSEIPRIEVK
ncbi:alanine racemase [bacterium]|nr:alanine racemase [bacterium]